MHRRTATIVLVGVLLAAIIVWLGRYTETRDSSRGAGITAEEEPDRDSGPAAGLATAPAPKRRTPANLPPHDAPLSAILPGLVASADAGDPRAACRLGMELLRCSQLAEWQRIVSAQGTDTESLLVAEGNLGAANFEAEEKIWRLERLSDCASVPDELRSQGADYLTRAARAGDPYAMLAYAEGQHFPLEGRGIAVDPAFDDWRRESAAMAHAALRAGNPTAAFSLFTAYQDDHSMLAALVPDDPYRTYVYHLLSVQLLGHREQVDRFASLGPESLESARREAADLHHRHFQGKRFESSRTFLPVPHIPSNSARAQAPFCTD